MVCRLFAKIRQRALLGYWKGAHTVFKRVWLSIAVEWTVHQSFVNHFGAPAHKAPVQAFVACLTVSTADRQIASPVNRWPASSNSMPVNDLLFGCVSKCRLLKFCPSLAGLLQALCGALPLVLCLLLVFASRGLCYKHCISKGSTVHC